MHKIILAAAAALVIAVGSAGAAAMSIAPDRATDQLAMLELIQAKKKSETVSQKVKRVWRSWTDYQFCVRCPIILPITSSICSVKRGITGPSREEARITCVNRNPLCYVNDAPC